ncbi:MAG: NAD-dependent malic enzyme [Lachnospiraceae bacterium]|nr:NAD-dependent malic enzyme [Lachnospiraceae bacterium]
MSLKKEEIPALALEMHEKLKGKLETTAKCAVDNEDTLALAYTPGVAQPCLEIKDHPEDVYKYTIKGNTCAVISDGSAVLGLGNIGAAAAIPVMEGKCVLFKEFGGVDAFPICLSTQDVDEIVETVKRIAPVFGGINLEDISAPRCFQVEERLKQELDIPVFHDDQHGTAVIVTAGLINACKVTGKKFSELKVAINGVGAAGTAIAKMILNFGVKDMFLVDRTGILCDGGNQGRNFSHAAMSKITNFEHREGGLDEALVGTDVFIGVSSANILTAERIKTMAPDPIVFAMANPNPEIDPAIAHEAGVAVIGTGRSDYPNQVNNVLAFPGIFRGAFDVRATEINEEMKMAASRALAALVSEEELSAEYILPKPFDERVCPAVAKAVAEAYKATH